jgi:hypothetical protein
VKLITRSGTEIKDCEALYGHSTMRLHGVVTKQSANFTFALLYNASHR